MMETDEQKILLLKHLDLVSAQNKVVNLTRISDREQGKLLHIEDSLAGLAEFNAAPEGRAADLGTGGGYPGIPLAIMSGRRMDLIESVGKKAKALIQIVHELNLDDQVVVKNERAEELALHDPGAYTVVVARAVAPLPSLLELASPLLAHQGQLIAYKSGHYLEELEHARAIERKVGMNFLKVRELQLSDGVTNRSIIVFEKASDPLVRLPRRPGMAQKNPYRK